MNPLSNRRRIQSSRPIRGWRSLPLPWYHLGGLTISVVTLTAVYSCWSDRGQAVTQIVVGDALLDLSDVHRLIDNADGLRQRYADAHDTSNKITDRVKEIESWLPEEHGEREIQLWINTLCEDQRLTLVDLDELETLTGRRVGVKTVTCRVSGDWPGICRLLDAISNDAREVACDDLEIQRVTPFTPDADPQAECVATISLRFPFAAADTPAAELHTIGDFNVSAHPKMSATPNADDPLETMNTSIKQGARDET